MDFQYKTNRQQTDWPSILYIIKDFLTITTNLRDLISNTLLRDNGYLSVNF